MTTTLPVLPVLPPETVSFYDDQRRTLWQALQGVTFEFGITMLGVHVCLTRVTCDRTTSPEHREMVLNAMWRRGDLRGEVQAWAARAAHPAGGPVRLDYTAC